MSNFDAGEAVIRAVQAMRSVYGQTDALFADLDNLFRKMGLVPGRAGNKGIEKRNLAANKTANLGEGRYWMPLQFWSTYAPSAEARPKRLLLVEAALDPDYADEPMLVAVGLRLSSRVAHAAVWDDWHVNDSLWSRVSGVARPGRPVGLSGEAARACYRRASSGRALAVKLCELTAWNVRARFVIPAAALLR